MKEKALGVSAVLIAGLMWAIEPVLAKLSYQNTDVMHTSAIRAIIVCLIALVYIMVSKHRSLSVTKKEGSILLYIAIVGTLFADLLYFYALSTIPVLNAVLIGHLQPVFIIVISFFLLRKDSLHKIDYLGILLLIISAVLVTTKTIANAQALRFGSTGDVMVLFATLAWATTAIAMRKYLPTVHAGTITFYRFFFASIVFSVYLLIQHIYTLYIYQIGVGIVVGIGTICYYEGLKRLKAAQVSGLELSAPVFAAIIGFFVLQETVTLLQILGMMLLIIGIVMISRKEPDKTVQQH